MELANREPWTEYAACAGIADPEIFFNERNDLPAKIVCAGCPVKNDCLTYALRRRHLVGVWGGKSDKQRDAIRRKHGIKTVEEPKPINHGTYGGARAHRRRGQEPCSSCLRAESAYTAKKWARTKAAAR